MHRRTSTLPCFFSLSFMISRLNFGESRRNSFMGGGMDKREVGSGNVYNGLGKRPARFH